jgi:hypothetical protein
MNVWAAIDSNWFMALGEAKFDEVMPFLLD